MGLPGWFDLLSSCCSDWPFYRACFPFKNFRESITEMGNFCRGVATRTGRKFFTQISEHFRAYFRLHWADHSNLVITWKIFSSCRSWVSRWCKFWSKVTTSEVEQGQGSSRVVAGRTGVNGLKECTCKRFDCLWKNQSDENVNATPGLSIRFSSILGERG